MEDTAVETQVSQNCTTRPQEYGQTPAVPTWLTPILRRRYCPVAKSWLLVLAFLVVARNCLTQPQGHGASQANSTMQTASIIRRRCSPMVRCWLLGEPTMMFSSALQTARSYTIPPREHGRRPATSIRPALITQRHCCQVAKSSSREGHLMISVLRTMQNCMIRIPEVGLSRATLT